MLVRRRTELWPSISTLIEIRKKQISRAVESLIEGRKSV